MFSSIISHASMAEGFHSLVCKALVLNFSKFINYIYFVLMLLALPIITYFLQTPTWPTNFSIKMNAANCLVLQSDRGFYKTISFPCSLLRNIFFHVCSCLFTRRSSQQQLGSNPGCLWVFSWNSQTLGLHFHRCFLQWVSRDWNSCVHKSQGTGWCPWTPTLITSMCEHDCTVKGAWRLHGGNPGLECSLCHSLGVGPSPVLILSLTLSLLLIKWR